MQTRHKQKGMTMWGAVFVLSVFAFVLFLMFKLFDPYKDNFKVQAALESLARQSGGSTPSKADMVSSLTKRFDIDDIEHVNMAKDLTVETHGQTSTIRIQYEVEIPIVHNVYILLKFNNAKQVRAGE